MTLVDTSVWIDFFRGREPAASRLDRLLDANEVAVCGPVVTELRRGIRTARERNRVLPLLDGCHTLEQPDQLWQEAGDLGFLLARRGLVVRSFDLLIATYALSHDVGLLAADTDFAHMRNAGIPLLLA